MSIEQLANQAKTLTAQIKQLETTREKAKDAKDWDAWCRLNQQVQMLHNERRKLHQQM